MMGRIAYSEIQDVGGRVAWWIVNLSLAASLALMTLMPSLAHMLLVGLAVIGVFHRYTQAGREGAERLPVEAWAIAAIPVVAIGTTLLFSMLVDVVPKSGWRKLEDMSWLLVLLSSWFVLRRYLDIRALALCIALGAVFSGSWAIWEVVSHPGGYRAVGMTGKPIVFGILGMALCSASAGISFCFSWRSPARYLLLVAAIFGLIAAVLSGSRGAYLFFPALLFVLAIIYRQRLSVKSVVGVLALIAVGLLIAWNFSTLPDRLERGVSDIREYVFDAAPSSSKAGASSLGVRLEMWRAAANGMLENPVLGVGLGNVQKFFAEKVASGEANQHVRVYEHAHNEYLNAGLTRGIAGLLASLVALLVPLVFFWRMRKDRLVGCIAATSVVVILLYAFAALSDSVFVFKKDFMLYAALILAFSAILRREVGRDANTVR